MNANKNLLVMKFGGTSMSSAERIKGAAGTCAGQKDKHPLVVVVSAMAQVTDLLLNTLRHAEAGDEVGIESNLERLGKRHLETCAELLEGQRRDGAIRGIQALITDFKRIVHGMLMLTAPPPRSPAPALS